MSNIGFNEDPTFGQSSGGGCLVLFLFVFFISCIPYALSRVQEADNTYLDEYVQEYAVPETITDSHDSNLTVSSETEQKCVAFICVQVNKQENDGDANNGDSSTDTVDHSTTTVDNSTSVTIFNYLPSDCSLDPAYRAATYDVGTAGGFAIKIGDHQFAWNGDLGYTNVADALTETDQASVVSCNNEDSANEFFQNLAGALE